MGMSTDVSSAWGLEPLLSVGELAEYLGVPVATVYDWRSNGLGPVGHRLGKHVRFALSDVKTWLESHRETLGVRPVPGGKGSASPRADWLGR